MRFYDVMMGHYSAYEQQGMIERANPWMHYSSTRQAGFSGSWGLQEYTAQPRSQVGTHKAQDVASMGWAGIQGMAGIATARARV